MTKELTNWYKKYHSNCYCSEFLEIYNNPKNTDKAFILLVGKDKLVRGCHAGYLWRFGRNHPYRDELLNRINTKLLWKASISHIGIFEDLYIFVKDQLNNPTIPQIGQLIIYDIAVHLACINGRTQMLQEKVYIHALPLRAWKNLVFYGIIPDVQLIDGKACYSKLALYFPGLSPFKIEDLLCHLGKSLRRVKYERKAIPPDETAIDNIVKRYINIKNIKYL